jgi:decaprenylphospho-beta-D-ribofuranose 2-oxidase
MGSTLPDLPDLYTQAVSRVSAAATRASISAPAAPADTEADERAGTEADEPTGTAVRVASNTAPQRREVLAGWGNTAPTAARVQHPAMRRELLSSFADAPDRGVLARGLGRSYGDAALNSGGRVIDTTRLDDIDLDPTTGMVTACAGISIDSLIRILVPRGFFVPVTPGTRYVTVGGAIAADIHGKNHHVSGSWCDHLESFRLLVPSGEVLDVSRHSDLELFWATAGGLGLTGIIVDATFRCPPVETSRLLVETIRAPDLDEIMALMADDQTEYSVAWIDLMATRRSMGRSVLTRGRFATLDELPASQQSDSYAYDADIVVSAPPIVPNGLLNSLSIRAFNEFWYRKAPAHRRDELQTIPMFFHPLDMVGHWNRLYGAAGFVQWQFAIPFGHEDSVRRIVERFSTSKCISFLAVLKTFGPRNAGPLSFPIGGWTLALDIPSGVPGLGRLLDVLDDEVAAHDGRIYLAKDSRLRAELVDTMYPRVHEWRAVRDKVDPDHVLQSDLSRRLNL